MTEIPPRKHKGKVPPGLSRRNNSEKGVVQNLLGSFVAKDSRGEALIREIMKGRELDKISRNSLISVTQIISGLIEVPFPRNSTRKKALIVKWYDDNEDIIRSKKGYIDIKFNENGENLEGQKND